MKAHSLKVFDTAIHYYTHGSGRPLLFIHGHRSDALRWKGIILFLGEKFKVYVPDLPGFGKSPALKKPQTMENHAHYLNKFVEKIKLKNYLLFGGSMGGIIALKMLKQKPKQIPSKLILVGTPYDKKYWRISLLKRILLQAKPLLPLMEKFINNDFLLYHLLYLFFPQEAKKPEIIEYEMRQWRVMSLKVWWETMVEILRVEFSKEKFQTKIPTLIINSQQDQYFDTQQTIKGLKKLCPNSQVILLPLNSHVPKGELKLEHLKELQPFLEKI